MEVSQANWKSRLSQNGDPQSEAIAELREILVKRVSYSFQNDAIVDSAFVDDIVQDSLLKILKSLDQFEGRAKFTTWATTIAIRTAYSELRRRHWKDVSLDALVESQGDSFTAAKTRESDRTERQRLVDAMHLAIKERLTEKQRIALQAELAGMPMEEIGRHTGSNRNAVYKLTHDARKRLRMELESDGFSEADFLSLQESN
jgi:RNA polymerase sigma-70 factor (ECF subfamily)